LTKAHQKVIRAWLGFRSVHVASQIQFIFSQGALVWHLRGRGKGFLGYFMSLIFSHEESQDSLDLRSRCLKLVSGLQMIRNRESAKRNYGSFGPDEV
jgi:hypothetical protein